MCPVPNCLCATRRHPEALPARFHQSRGSRANREYFEAVQDAGRLPAVLGTVAHGGTAHARRRAARASRFL